MTPKIKILYVDDEPINLQLFEIIFNSQYEILTAKNGIEGLSVLEKSPDIKIILSDMKMPIMSGLNFIQKAHELYPDKKYFIVTGFEATPEILNAVDSELIVKHLSKPFIINEIKTEIANALK